MLTLNWSHSIFFFYCFLTTSVKMCCTSKLFHQSQRIGDFRNVFKFHAYSVNKRLSWRPQSLSDVATTNVCKVDTSIRNHIERSRWMKWLITGLRQKKYPLIWIHYESPLLAKSLFSFYCFWPTSVKICHKSTLLHQSQRIAKSLFFSTLISRNLS